MPTGRKLGEPPRTDIFVRQLVGKPDSLRLVLDGLAVDDGRLELLRDTPMDGIALANTS
jgi:hypothetical protein